MKKDKKVKLTQTEIIQANIREGRQVVMKKENETLFVRIRFNNTDTDGSEKWRLIVNGNEFHTSEIIINCSTRTLTEKFEDIGIKHHVVCEAKEVIFKDNVATIN
jgi:hypothetical protein